jgi:uncharacterized protein
MSLHTDLKAQMIEAMKAKDATRLSVIRGLLSSFTNELVATSRKPDEFLTDEEVLTVISRAVKQRKDSIEQFTKGGRADLAEVEQAELLILNSWLPAQMSEDEIRAFVVSKIASEQPTREKAGQFTGLIMKELKGKADGALVKQTVDNLLV